VWGLKRFKKNSSNLEENGIIYVYLRNCLILLVAGGGGVVVYCSIIINHKIYKKLSLRNLKM
jgi:hypothetical protein